MTWTIDGPQGNEAAKCVNVYGLCSSEDGIVRYIGQTIKPVAERLKEHIRHARTYRHRHVSCWINRVLGAGHTILVTTLATNAIWNETEIKLIAEYRANGTNLVNGTPGGDGGKGRQWSDEQRQLQSERMRGKKKSAEHVANMSRARKGKPLPPGVAEKVSAALKGKMPKNLESIQRKNKGITRPPALRARISASLKGRMVTPIDKLLCNLEKARAKVNGLDY